MSDPISDSATIDPSTADNDLGAADANGAVDDPGSDGGAVDDPGSDGGAVDPGSDGGAIDDPGSDGGVVDNPGSDPAGGAVDDPGSGGGAVDDPDPDPAGGAADETGSSQSPSGGTVLNGTNQGSNASGSSSSTSSVKASTRTFQLDLIFNDINGAPLVGTWVLDYGSLQELTIESHDPREAITFPVELDTTKHNQFSLRGNPYLTGVSFPPGSEFYFHNITVVPALGANNNLTFEISQTPTSITFIDSDTMSDAEIKQRAVTNEIGAQVGGSIESGALLGLIAKASLNASISAKHALTTTTGGTSTTGETHSMQYTVEVAARRLAFKQDG